MKNYEKFQFYLQPRSISVSKSSTVNSHLTDHINGSFVNSYDGRGWFDQQSTTTTTETLRHMIREFDGKQIQTNSLKWILIGKIMWRAKTLCLLGRMFAIVCKWKWCKIHFSVIYSWFFFSRCLVFTVFVGFGCFKWKRRGQYWRDGRRESFSNMSYVILNLLTSEAAPSQPNEPQ